MDSIEELSAIVLPRRTQGRLFLTISSEKKFKSFTYSYIARRRYTSENSQREIALAKNRATSELAYGELRDCFGRVGFHSAVSSIPSFHGALLEWTEAEEVLLLESTR